MKRYRNRLVIHAVALTVAFGAATLDRGLAAQAFPGPNYGITAESSQYVGSAAFHGVVENTWVVTDPGLSATFAGTGTKVAWAPISLPQGALITGVYFDYYDADATYDLSSDVYELDRFAMNTVLASLASSGSAGLGRTSAVVSPPWVVNNGDNGYAVFVQAPASASTGLAWRGVRVRYTLQVSPAPTVATFSDVPTDYWAFQYIEALKASGITQGVTPTTYEPESSVTRAQMAVFLAKALGLHWPN